MSINPHQNPDCPFCDYEGPSEVLKDFEDSYVIEPLRQITPGHVLVVPKIHVTDFASDPRVTAWVYRDAASWWRIADGTGPANLITSKGAEATQTVKHFHIHVVPRRRDDGLQLPWANPNSGPHESGFDLIPVWLGQTGAGPFKCPVCGSVGTGFGMCDHIAERHATWRPALPVQKAKTL